MRVYDIYPEASEYLGTKDQTHIFRVSGRAAEYLANKGDWDILKGYVDLPIQSGNIVVLPWQVDVPLKFTINDVPSFSLDRLYEFTLNGFGSNPGADRTDYSWEDRGFSPTSFIPPQDGFRITIPPSTTDAGKRVFIQGQTPPNSGNVEVKETMTVDATNWIFSFYHYGKITEVNKEVTTAPLTMYYLTPPPPNDNFVAAQVLTGVNSDPTTPISGSTINATVEVGEPNYAGVVNTVWYQWVGADDGKVAYFSTRPDHIIEVYVGTMFSDMSLMGTSRVTQEDVSQVQFIQAFGTNYWIRVRPSDPGITGLFNLSWVSLPVPPQLGSAVPPVGKFPPTAPGPPLPPQANPPSGTILIAYYFPTETNPRYRVIRLSKSGASARFLFRRKVFKIVSMDDFIPIQSELGFLTMLQAIQALRRKDMEVAKAMADAAVEITTDAQRATTGFIELANNTEVHAARNYQIYNRDSVIVMDVFDDVAKIMGNVGYFEIYDVLTNALEVLCTKGHYDGLTGYVDITVDGWRNVTLPRFVDQPVTISINGRPAMMRNKWSEFHLNGPGSDEYGGGNSIGESGAWSGSSGNGRWNHVRAWDSVGEVCTIKPLRTVSQLVAIPDDVSDDGKTITVYGYDQTGKWIRTNGQDGFVITTDHSKLVPVLNVDQTVARIERITRQATNGFVRLYAFDIVDQTESDLMGYYYPDETEPKYFRIKLPCDAKWIRLRYRKRTLKVTSIWQPLHLHSRMAITTMVRSFKALDTDAAQAQVFEDKAVKYLDDDQKTRNPGETFQLQFNEDCGWNSNFITS